MPVAARVIVGKVTEGMVVTIESRMREEKRSRLTSAVVARDLLLPSWACRTCLHASGSFPESYSILRRSFLPLGKDLSSL